uniref:Uncharacterized protein n=1 Tax=Cacopsylla melanoneura TaxID=428564 RepID=A0A8D9FDE4_9HEMI
MSQPFSRYQFTVISITGMLCCIEVGVFYCKGRITRFAQGHIFLLSSGITMLIYTRACRSMYGRQITRYVRESKNNTGTITALQYQFKNKTFPKGNWKVVKNFNLYC